MTSSRANELLRKPEQPPQPTFLELFVDLVYVFAFTRITQRLIRDLTVHRGIFLTEVGRTLLLLLALLMVWYLGVWVTDLYNQQRPEIRLVIAWDLFGSLLMALALPEAFGHRGLDFAGAYVAIHIGRGLVLVTSLRGHEAQRPPAGVLLWFAVSAVPWIVGAIVSSPTRVALWILALAIDYTGTILFYPAPWTGPMRRQWPVVPEHSAERYRQFFIIALGELVLIAGTTYGGNYFGGYGGHTAAFVVSFINTVLLWQIYTHRAGDALPGAIATASHPYRTIGRVLEAHLLMVVGVLAISAGYELVIQHPFGRIDPVWLTVMLGGPALFIAGRARFEHAVFARVSWDRRIGLLVLVALAPVMRFVPPLAVATTTMAVLLGIAIVDAARTRGLPPESPSPPPTGRPS